jgi:hypothetical protein
MRDDGPVLYVGRVPDSDRPEPDDPSASEPGGAPNPFEESVPLHGRRADPPPRPPRTPAGFSGMEWLGGDGEDLPPTSRVRESGPPPSSGTRRTARARREPSDRNALGTMVILGVTAVVVIAALVMGVMWARPDSPRRPAPRATASHAPPAASSIAQTPADSAATPGCVDSERGGVVTGTSPGGPDSGPDAIMWFQHSYYVERSAKRAREMVADNAAVGSAEYIQRGINSVPYGTRYCVRVTTVDDNKFRVELTEERPGSPAATYVEIVTTALSADGRTMITGITAG